MWHNRIGTDCYKTVPAGKGTCPNLHYVELKDEAYRLGIPYKTLISTVYRFLILLDPISGVPEKQSRPHLQSQYKRLLPELQQE